MITIENLSFYYKKNKKLFENFSYEFTSDNSYIICGENGTGKTTFLKLILGLLKPTDGKVTVLQKAIIGYVPDYNGLYEKLTVIDNIYFRLGLYEKNIENIEKELTMKLSRFKLTEYRDTKVRELSLGTKKKVSLLCASIIEPDILILDEPSSGLDKYAKKELLKIIETFKKDGLLLIIVSHDSEFINSFDNTVIEI